MQCVILAGGLATRLRPITESIPKALVEVNGVPFADLQLELLAQQGVAEVVYSIGYRGEQIEAHVGDGSQWGLKVQYVREGDQLRGTGGALKLAEEQGVLAERFLVIYGDSYLRCDYRGVFAALEQPEADAVMTIFRNEGRFDRSNVRYLDGEMLYDKRIEDPAAAGFDYIDYGLSAIKRDVALAQIPTEGRPDLADLYHALSLRGRLVGFPVAERFYEVGTTEGIAELERYLAS